MANSGVRHVRCPKCQSLLQEPSDVPLYQCGGCGATLRAKNRSGDTQGSASPSSRSAPAPQSQSSHLLGSGDVASTSRSSTPTPPPYYARSSEQQATSSGDLVSARKHGSGDVASTGTDATGARRSQETNNMATTSDLVSVRKDRWSTSDVASTSSTTPDVITSSSRRQQASCPSGDVIVSTSKTLPEEHAPEIEKKEHDQSSGDAERNNVSVNLGRGFRDHPRTCELQADSEKRRKDGAELPQAARKRHSGEAVQSQSRDRQEPAPKSAEQAAESQPSRDAPPPPAAASRGNVPTSPPRQHELQAEDLAPLRHKILKTVDALKGDLSELFSKSPDLNPTATRRARPPRRPKQEEHAAAVANHRHGSSAGKPAHRQVAAPPNWRGLPSRRYRRCRADHLHPSCDNNSNVQPRRTTCHHHGCCCHSHHHHGKPECGSCRGHCGRPARPHDQEPRKQPPARREEAKKRRPAPRHHCRPVLKGAPFIVCSACFQLVQVPADFAVSTNRLRKLRCGACSTVLSYSYRDPARNKHFATSKGGGYADPFAPFTDGFGPSSHSTTDDDESPPLHVSRNTSFDTSLDGVKRQGRLHRLMGYGSASELLRHSPDLYESFDHRTTPAYDRKGKGVCVDDDDFVDDSDDDDDGAQRKRGPIWPMPGAPPPGAIRIKS